MLYVPWSQIKQANDNNKILHKISYLDDGSKYTVWVFFQGLTLICDSLFKGGEEATEFEANYKALANVPEANLVRITTNRTGRRFHDRYITFTTATTGGAFDNTDWKDRDFADLTYIMVDSNGQVTTDGSLAKETWLDWEPPYDYEISGGWVCVPDLLPVDENAWEIHVVAVPDIPQQYGGEIMLIANPRLKWSRDSRLAIDASLNPAEMRYDTTYHTNKLRFVIKHPVGAQCEMQLNIKVFK